MPEPLRQVNLKLPGELVERFDEYARSISQDRTAALKALMVAALNNSTPAAGTQGGYVDPEARSALIKLRERVEALESEIRRLGANADGFSSSF